MQRRDFIINSFLGGSALVVGCKEKDPYAQRKYEGQIAIIGAGAAGVYAGYLLEEKGANYTIFEASDQIGGRIRSLKGFTDFDIELGADKIRGKSSLWYDWAKESGATFVTPVSTTDYFQVGGLPRTEAQLKGDLDFRDALLLTNQARNYTAADITLQQYIINNKLPTRVQHIPNALISNEYGTSASRLSLVGIAEEEQIKSSGNDIIEIANRSLLSVLEEKCKNVIPKIVFNKPIKKIDFSNELIVLEDDQGQRRFVNKVIITVPLSILQSNELQFAPALPDTKIAAIKNIGIGAGMKIVLSFSRRFWESDMAVIYPSGIVPKYQVSSNGKSTKSFVLTAVVMGEKAETLSSQTNVAIVQNLLKDLDNLFGNGVASASFTNARVMDWGKEPFIKGSYSYPIVGGGGLLTRQALSQPVLRKLYFAGEATHYGGHSGTVHGAMESSRRAVEELLRDVT
ncbi:MAG: NAD(P)/FAD-dependent oxidoreductase [Spirosomataceae bacterium]